uniref:non-specific serine/threonine protein kinase n=1 Tax=Thelazia callipaeda TaxID=103827 RepID=A0A0N5CMY9_THECL
LIFVEPITTYHYEQFLSGSFFEQTFSKIRCIGAGSFGQVFKALSKDDGRWYAVKISVEPFRCSRDRRHKLKEVEIHELLPKHPNLVSFVRAWEEFNFLYIQTELCMCSLASYQLKVKVIPEEKLWLFFADIAMAIQFLHSHELIHLDIKPANVMVSFDGICKLGDFSLILDIVKMTEGDAKYLAVEALQGNPGKFSDIFSFGMTMIDVCTDNVLPSSGDSWHEFRYGHFFSDIPPLMLEIILRLIDANPLARLTAEQICAIPTVASCIQKRQVYLIRFWS